MGHLVARASAAVLADGTAVFFTVYRASVIWDGQPVAVLIDEMDSEPLIGMRLMLGYRILIEDIDGARCRLSACERTAQNSGLRFQI